MKLPPEQDGMNIMPDGFEYPVKNLILDAIPELDFVNLKQYFELVELNLHDIVHVANSLIEYVYFPVSGICSVIAVTDDNIRIEAGIIGREGFVGVSVPLFVEMAPFEVIVQVPGRALRISRNSFTRAMDESPDLKIAVLQYIHVFLVQSAHTALANGKLTIEQRLARWLLMCQDRVDTPDFIITHSFLSVMLAVRRPGVTEALQVLESKSAVKATRGKIKILDRVKLESLAKGAYGVPEREYQRLLD
jgi:CRP-like cAMP-binding protein